MPTAWAARDIPDQRGRTVVVTGANAGLGLATTRALARRGARVIMACRNTDKASAAARSVRAGQPDADVHVAALDLADLSSVRSFAASIDRDVDLLINNAGVMGGPRQHTGEGFEQQMGINHLGHFALTGLLLDRMTTVVGSRVVTVSSIAAESDTLDVDDMDSERTASWNDAYGASKQANAVFAVELQRRLAASGAQAISLAAHPGVSATNLADHMVPSVLRRPFGLLMGLVVNSAEQGALPQLRAATDPDARGGEYYGPDGFRSMRGQPERQALPPRAGDPDLGRRLWQRSEQVTGVQFLSAAV